MFTQAGVRALVKLILITFLAQGLEALTRWLWDFSVIEYVFVFFLLMYMVRTEDLKIELDIVKSTQLFWRNHG